MEVAVNFILIEDINLKVNKIDVEEGFKNNV